MNKTVLTLLTFIALSMGTASAQSCCKAEKEVCKPKVCCPTTPSCCEEDKTSDAAIESNNETKNQRTKSNINKAIAPKKEVATVASKN